MPSNKGHRVASKQAQLSRKKRRGKGRPQEFFPGPTEPSQTTETAAQAPSVETEDQEAQQQPAAAPAPARTAVATAPRTRTSAPRRNRQPRVSTPQTPTIYQHLGTELRHIGIISTVIIVILVALTFVLR